MSTRATHTWRSVLAPVSGVACAVGSAVGCASTTPLCVTTETNVVEAGGGSDDSGDDGTGPGYVAVTGTTSDTLCPSVNPIGIGPDNAGAVEVVATINNTTEDAGAFTFGWTASYGNFSNPGALDTTYLCTLAGPITVTFVISAPGCQPQEADGIVECNVLVGSP